jgi:hypothetical protein
MLPLRVEPLWIVPLALLLVAPRPAGAGGKLGKVVPAVDIRSGKALNTLLRDISQAHARGRRGPRVELKAEVLRQVNVAPRPGENFGLLRGGGKLTWPLAFAGDKFRADRENVEGQLIRALRALEQGTAPAEGVLQDLNNGVERVSATLMAEVNEIPVGQYIEARRYLNYLVGAARAVRAADARKYLDGTYTAQGKTVQELVDRMTRLGLTFAEAVPGQEAAYQALYQALAAYARGVAPGK